MPLLLRKRAACREARHVAEHSCWAKLSKRRAHVATVSSELISLPSCMRRRHLCKSFQTVSVLLLVGNHK
eukprot:716749-Amphidinium_carterae.2